VQALSMTLGWNAAVVEPVAVEPGDWLAQMNGVALSPKPGVADVALLGTGEGGLAGEGVVAVVRFKALTAGDPEVGMATLLARNAVNQPVELSTSVRHEVPTVTMLAGVYPNPFQGETSVAFSLAEQGRVSIVVFGVDGRKVRTLTDGLWEPGAYRLGWDGRDDQGHTVSSGVYFVRMSTPHARYTKTITNLR
jgi:hypothetical protein